MLLQDTQRWKPNLEQGALIHPRQQTVQRLCNCMHSFWNVTIISLTRAGPLLGAEHAGPGSVCPPPLTRLLGYVVTRGKRHSIVRKKLWRNCFGHFQVRSPEVSKGQFCGFQHFSTNRHRTREPSTRRATAPRKSAFDLSFSALLLNCAQIWPKINGFASREEKLI